MLEGEETPVPSSPRVRERQLSAAFTLPARCPYGIPADQPYAQAETHIQCQEAAQFTQADTKWPRVGSFAPQLTGAIRPDVGEEAVSSSGLVNALPPVTWSQRRGRILMTRLFALCGHSGDNEGRNVCLIITGYILVRDRQWTHVLPLNLMDC